MAPARLMEHNTSTYGHDVIGVPFGQDFERYVSDLPLRPVQLDGMWDMPDSQAGLMRLMRMMQTIFGIIYTLSRVKRYQ